MPCIAEWEAYAHDLRLLEVAHTQTIAGHPILEVTPEISAARMHLEIVASAISEKVNELLPELGRDGYDTQPFCQWELGHTLEQSSQLVASLKAHCDRLKWHQAVQPASHGESILTDRQQWLLQAAHELGAFDSDSRVLGIELARKAGFGYGVGKIPRTALSQLRKQGLLSASKYRGGGYWLTPTGRARAEKLNVAGTP